MRQLNLNEVSNVSGGFTLATSDWDFLVRAGGAYVGWTKSAELLDVVGQKGWGFTGQLVTAATFMEVARVANNFVTGWVEPKLDGAVKSVTG